LLGREKALLEKRTNEDTAEFARAKDGYMLVGKFGSHGQNIVTEEGRRVNWRIAQANGVRPKRWHESQRYSQS
jgi:hypothetical protein